MVKAPPIPPSLKSQFQRLKLPFHRASMDVAEAICPLQSQPFLPSPVPSQMLLPASCSASIM